MYVKNHPSSITLEDLLRRANEGSCLFQACVMLGILAVLYVFRDLPREFGLVLNTTQPQKGAQLLSVTDSII